MASTRIRPPFAWLGSYTTPISLGLVIAIAAFFRFYRLDTLPPGLYDNSARVGLQALDLIRHGTLPMPNLDNGYAILWPWLQAVAIKLFGNTELALRLWPALLGVLGVATTWLWAGSWFGRRIAWLAAFLVAVTPWSVTLSRNGLEAAAFPLLITLTLWLATRAYRSPTVAANLFLAGILLLNVLSGPIGWLIALTTMVTGFVLLVRSKQLRKLKSSQLMGAGASLLAGAAAVYLLIASWSSLKHLPAAIGLTVDPVALGNNIVKTLLMFNVYGDESYRHNLSGEPLLNVFVGLMLVAGILVSIARLHGRRYRLLYVFAIAMLLPALLTTTGAPNAARAAATLPLILTFAAIGISYMLELWYATFPINSAARTIGQTAILTLLALTLFQGYTQYFRAWAGSSEVHTAYNEGAVRIARDLDRYPFAGQHFVITPVDQQSIVAYLNQNKTAYLALEPKQLTALPVEAGARQFLITATSRDEAVKLLRAKFPGGVLRPHYSDFNQTEIYYSYEVTK